MRFIWSQVPEAEPGNYVHNRLLNAVLFRGLRVHPLPVVPSPVLSRINTNEKEHREKEREGDRAKRKTARTKLGKQGVGAKKAAAICSKDK